MNILLGHLSRCLIAGIVALLPVGGIILTLVWLESALAGSWLARQPFYFPGCGILAAIIVVYLIGLTVSTFVGRWMWSRIDMVLNGLPALGRLYLTLKQILGYGEGKEGMFLGVVLVTTEKNGAQEIGLITNEVKTPEGASRLVVFIPGAPNPTAGRLVMVDVSVTQPLLLPVSESLKLLVSLGKTPSEGPWIA